MTAKPAEEKVEGKGKEGKKGKPLLLIILIIVLVLGLGAAGLFFFGVGLPFLGDDSADQPDVETPPEYSYSMEEYQVNLADPGNRRFLRMTIDLAYDEKDLAGEIEEREAELRSKIISVLRSKYVEDLEEPGGMESLEQDLLRAINDILNTGEVEAIYYKEFIFQ
ncbi:MAG: flagellar basal body-associated FliL family protein [Bacillota bacterium]